MYRITKMGNKYFPVKIKKLTIGVWEDIKSLLDTDDSVLICPSLYNGAELLKIHIDEIELLEN